MVRVCIVSLLLCVGIAHAQDSFSLPAPGVYRQTVHDDVALSGGRADTSGVVRIHGADLYGFFARYNATNDSVNIRVYADFSTDGAWWPITVGLDTMIASGTVDTSRAKDMSNIFLDHPIYARSRIVSAAAVTDTVVVKVVWTVHYLGLLRLR